MEITIEFILYSFILSPLFFLQSYHYIYFIVCVAYKKAHKNITIFILYNNVVI